MPTCRIGGRPIDVNDEGFLTVYDQWDEELAPVLGRGAGPRARAPPARAVGEGPSVGPTPAVDDGREPVRCGSRRAARRAAGAAVPRP